MLNKLQAFALIIYADSAAFFTKTKTNWDTKKISGEIWSTLDDSDQPLPDLLRQFENILNITGKLANVEIHLVYAKNAAGRLASVPEALTELGCNHWQVLRLEPLLNRVRSVAKAPSCKECDEDWLCKFLLPVLESTFNYTDEALQVERAREEQSHQETKETLRDDIRRLNQEKVALQAYVESLQRPDIERLTTFLPAIYRNFWGIVSPSELALLSDNTSIPNIPSPYLDPSADTVMTIKKKLQKLPKSEQEKVRLFCKELTHPLKVREEMRDWLEDENG